MLVFYSGAQLFKFIPYSCKNIRCNRYRMYNFLCLSFSTFLKFHIRNEARSFQTTCCGFNKVNYTMEVPDGLFRGQVDRFNGVTIDSSKECEDETEFTRKLQKSLDYWIENDYRCIWFKVHKHHSNFIPELTKTGFDFHHAKNGFVMLYRWLPAAETANIPDYAHTLIGVGGLVVNDKNEILVVTERHALIPNSWKLPGGYVEPKEDLVDAAIREVQEETGIETEFETVIAFRHSHSSGFGCSDLYFVIGLKPITKRLKTCPREISKAQWMPIIEYLNHPNVHETNRTFLKTFLHYKEMGITFNYLSATHKILNRKYLLYTVEQQNTRANIGILK